MPDRFDNAKWLIGGGDGLNTIIVDVSDREGTGPGGYGMVCQDAVLEDAALIIQAPTLLTVARWLVASSDCDDTEDTKYERLLDDAIGLARAVIDKVAGRPVIHNLDGPIPFFDDCSTGDHGCYNDDQTCGCWCVDCIDLTEPRCSRCNDVLVDGVCPNAPNCVEA